MIPDIMRTLGWKERTALFVVASAMIGATPARLRPSTAFSQDEVRSVLSFWSDKAQYSARPAGEPGAEWCVRTTPEGSTWIREVYRRFTASKVNPTFDPQGSDARQRVWIGWIDRQVARDWAQSESDVARLNQERAETWDGRAMPEKPKPTSPQSKSDPASAGGFTRKTGTDKTGGTFPSPIPVPGDDPCPTDMVAAVGTAPRFSEPVRPMKHTVTYPAGLALNYTDHVKVRPKYAYYRFAEGVNSEGVSVKTLPSGTLDRLFRLAGFGPTERNVMKAVSLLEGGFDSVNTYDTGYVSVGFIQFATLADGSGSLGSMMRLYKGTDRKNFDNDFRRFGIDVDDDGFLVALDLETGEERTGPEAARQIIKDPRLVSVFQRAGLQSEPFRVAQIRSAKAQFYPADTTVQVRLGGSDYTVRLGDVFRTEAGLATLMDRKTNTGKLAGLKESIEKLATQYGITAPGELRDLEYLAIKAMTYREDYLSRSSLTRPRDNTIELSRRGTRFDRKGGKGKGAGR
ncbi:MAG: hypothetical protein JST30_13740 [Armatimonadetes bacterium]|nr:hypothetical protein [Armatimonadota bacterium]